MSTIPLEVVPCVLCRGESFDLICPAHEVEIHLDFLRRFHRRRLKPDVPRAALLDRSDFTQDYPTDIVACRECGLILRNPRPAPEEIERMYARDEYGPERLAQLAESQSALYRPKAVLLSRWLKPASKVVEVGSFVGGFLEAGKERGWEMTGLDPGEEVNRFCRECRLPVRQGTLVDADFPPASLDGVAIWNTFDQIPDPELILRAASRLLKEGGILAVRIPNGDCFRWGVHSLHRWRHARFPLRMVWGPLLAMMAWNNLLAFPYLYGYTVRTLDRYLGGHGFQRIFAEADTLCRLSDEQTKFWGRWEEQTIKWLIRLAARMQFRTSPNRPSLAPWLDLVYRKINEGNTDPIVWER